MIFFLGGGYGDGVRSGGRGGGGDRYGGDSGQLIQKQIDAIMREQESLARNQKLNGSVVHGWPIDVLPFTKEDVNSAAAKLQIVKRFFEIALKMPADVIDEVDINSIYVERGPKCHVIINFMRQTDKEIANSYLKNLADFNKDRTRQVNWRDDLTKLQMEKKRALRAGSGRGE